MFVCSKPKIGMFEFIRCSKNDVQVCLIFDKMVFDPSLLRSGWLNNVRYSMFVCSKPKIGFLSSITNKRTHLGLFDVRVIEIIFDLIKLA